MPCSASPGAYLTSLHPKHQQFEGLRQALIKAVAASKAKGRKPGSDGTVQRLIVNMERWRWMPADLGSYYVWNNIPAFTARVMKGGKSIYVEKVIVGQVKYATPIFSADMRSIVFNPDWTVPETIKLEDLRPRLRQTRGGVPDVSVLRDNQLTVSYQGRPVNAETVDWERANILSYTFTQAPGPDNVLGTLKFNFPNRHAVYMHDTVQPALFNQTVRTLSHGCIRVHQPDRLALLLLAEDKGWTEQQVKDQLAKGRNSGVTLSRPVPVHLTYFTVAFDGIGKMRTYDDVYDLDKKMAVALFGKAEAPAPDAPVVARPQKRSASNGGRGFGGRHTRPVRQLIERRYLAAAISVCLSAARIARASSLSDGSRAPITSTRSPCLASSATRATSRSREAANSAWVPSAPISATISAAEKSRVAVPPA